MKYRNIIFAWAIIFSSVMLFQAHSDGRATRGRDNTGAPGGQGGGNGPITCNNCHNNGSFDTALNLELLDANDNPITEYIPNQTYIARVTIETVSGMDPSGYGFQMVSLLDSNDSDVNGWVETGISSNVQLTRIDNLDRVFAEHNDLSSSNVFTAVWTAPAQNSGDLSFYVAGIAANSNQASSGDTSPELIKVTFAESETTSTSQINANFDLDIYPNPSSEFINISGDIENKFVEIYQFGKLLQTMESNSKNATLSLNNYSAGLYILVLRDKNKQVLASRKLVKH